MNKGIDFLKLMDESINELAKEFNENELAYLAIVSKVERPVHDKLVYILHKKMKDKFLVAKEWYAGKIDGKKSSVDIAILDNQTPYAPYCLIELKATNTQTGATLKHIEKHLKSLREDLERDLWKIKSEQDVTVFGIFVAAHPVEIIKNQTPVIKYYTRPSSPTKMLGDYNKKVESFFSDMEMKKYEICGGNYYDTPIKLFVHLLWSN